MKHPLLTISIALCTYNGERFLQEQLDSIANQTRLPDEVVVGDDGSTDDTAKILEAWVQTVPFVVRIFRNEKNLGYVQNFEKTMGRCTGDLIFLSDQDDIWKPEKLETMTRLFSQEPDLLLAVSDADVIDSAGRSMGFLREKLTRDFLTWAEPSYLNQKVPAFREVSGCCMGFRRGVLEAILPIPKGFGHDMWLFYVLSAMGKIKYVREPLLFCRIHAHNTAMEGNAAWKEDTLAVRWDWIRWRYPLYVRFQPMIEELRQNVQAFPNCLEKRRLLSWLAANDLHYPAKERIRRNFYLFSPLFFREVFTLRYFQHPHPFLNMFSDILAGLGGGLTGTGWDLLRKIFPAKKGISHDT